ncbi:hypothetical protein DBV23_00865 [Edwardsiella ictaluri]|uniref:Lipoprotein n=2 Tax=Edwardsiella ictaluri TaxID=67780 RepID=C5B7Z7_EDWI9|nr:hypothetical protein [Edwardsiella ictaluri]ACR68733.2 hypothetical protein NT01EI_1547 [Edwardsiella ictaluri 93-146]ARD38163.1 hypothetical protein B6E78_00935 [Edwardsiella ictaluri]AVZ81011.1 hypothetical protein DBV23_00865 [Edwardsiella ictaluri]EKS7764850.1 hypothetical protein [Edwardsiella ictaluri]EKS7771753.1 hypothetical protein [Edwardsiella ictaluri]
MKKHNVIYLAVMITLLQGCTLQPSHTKNTPPKAPSNGYEEVNGISSDLQTCLFEANQLKSIDDKKYSNQIFTLYKTVSEAKYYMSIYKSINQDTKSTITPLYTYKINNICNAISQSMMSELEKGVLQSVDK